jgi:Na+/melibiose symporter-like transporter
MHTSLRLIRVSCINLMIAGIPALIISSIAGNNEGWVLTFGMISAVAAIIFMAVSAASSTQRLDAFDDVVAERVEQRIRMLVDAGADETDVRNLVRDTMNLARGQE